MSCIGGPREVTANLVFYYDMSNTQKSWLGAYTTNMITNGDMSSGITGYNNYVVTPTIVTSTTVPRTYGISRNVLQASTTTLGGGGNYGGFNRTAPVFTAGQPYSVSFFGKSLSGNMSFTMSNQNGAGDQSNFSTAWTLTSDWKYFTYSTSSLDLVKTQLYFWNGNVANGIFQIADLQIENRSFSTPFVNGSRGTSNNIIDLTNNNTITATSLTYDANGSFSFNGISDYMSLPASSTNSLNPNALTAEAWVYHRSWGGASDGRTYINNWHNYLPSGSQQGFILRTYSSQQYPSFWWCYGATNLYNAVYASGMTMSLNTWYHVVGTFQVGMASRIYVNGMLQNSVTDTTVNTPLVYDTNNGIFIGYSEINGSKMDGIISVAKIYNRALSADEVKQNFNALRGRYGI